VVDLSVVHANSNVFLDGVYSAPNGPAVSSKELEKEIAEYLDRKGIDDSNPFRGEFADKIFAKIDASQGRISVAELKEWIKSDLADFFAPQASVLSYPGVTHDILSEIYVGFLGFPASSVPAADPKPAHSPIPNWQPGIDKHGRISRGGQPTGADYKWLRDHGYNTIIDFCDGSWKNTDARHGKDFRHVIDIPTSASEINSKEPVYVHGVKYTKQEYLAALFLKVIGDVLKDPHAKVFIHCAQGMDRTGFFSAVYELIENKDNKADVISQLKRHGGGRDPGVLSFISHMTPEEADKIKALSNNPHLHPYDGGRVRELHR